MPIPAARSTIAGRSTPSFGAVGRSPIYSKVYIIRSNQNSNYNGLQVTLEQRLTHHVSAKGYYTWSKTLQSNTLDATGGLNGVFVDANYPQLEYRQRSDQDRRHMMTMSFVWKPDYFDHYNRFVRTTLNGWTITGIWTANSGQPFTVTTGIDNYFSGNGNNRPSIVPGKIPHTIPNRSRVAEMAQWFDTSAYCRPGIDAGCPGLGPLGLLGNERPAQLDVPGYRNVDASLFRNFTSTNRSNFQLRGEVSQRLQPRESRHSIGRSSTAPPSDRSPEAAAVNASSRLEGASSSNVPQTLFQSGGTSCVARSFLP